MTAPTAQDVTTVGSLCSGYEGIGLAVEAVVGQVEYLWHADNDPGATKVLETRFPGVPNLDDISTVDWSTVETPDILVTGFPCTDLSLAGAGKGLQDGTVVPAGIEDCGCPWADHVAATCLTSFGGITIADRYADPELDDFEPDYLVRQLNAEDRDGDGPRPERTVGATRSGVWKHVNAAIVALRPGLVVIENVPGILSTKADRGMAPGDPYVEAAGDDALRALGRVLGDLAEAGFDAEWITVAASEVGAVHRRLRVFILAWPQEAGTPERFAARAVQFAEGAGGGRGHVADAEGDPWRLLNRNSVPAADAEGIGHGHPGTAGIGGLPSTAVGGAAEAVDLLPTPAASRSGRQRSASPGAAIRPSLDSITSLLPPPMAADSDRTSLEMRRGNPTLLGALLPTPSARDWKSGQSNIMDRNARPLNEVVTNLLPTPMASLGRGTGTPSADTAQDRYDQGKRCLDDAIALLPTPRATDGTNGGPNQRGSSGDLMLPSAVMLMPTPMAADGGANRGSSAGYGMRNTSRTLHDSWGPYAAAILRWERVIGREAPAPTEPGAKGKPRLSSRFVEWMMGLPDGWVTAVPGLKRNDQLRILGNGVVWLQAAYALWILLARATEARSDLVGAAR